MKLKLILVIVLLTGNAFSQTNPEKFVKALINNGDNIRDFVDETELTRSERLGITYTDVKNKFLIGYDIDEQVKSDLKEGRLQYDVKEKVLEDNYSQVEFSVPAIKYSKLFYFHHGKFISPTTYLTRNWLTKESKYFIFKISEPKYFNDYCVKRLDDFVDKIADTLEFSDSDRELLRQQKIYYIFCKDEDEVQELTGYKSKGQAILAFDEVITAYQTHFHELSHLLINYKLKNLGLYTLPFFMEGFAVAMGGRGGMAPRVVTDVGYYLQKTAFLTYDSILTYDAFTSQDANMTYAVSGLYNMFLFNELGVDKYLELYKHVNGDLENIKKIKYSEFSLPDDNAFIGFLSRYENGFSITPEYLGSIQYKDNVLSDVSGYPNYKRLDESKSVYFNIYQNDNAYIYDTLNMGDIYVSRISNRNYDPVNGLHCKYLVTADSISIKVYNCYNDELLASYETNFSLSHLLVPVSGKGNRGAPLPQFFSFTVSSDIFNNELRDIAELVIIK